MQDVATAEEHAEQFRTFSLRGGVDWRHIPDMVGETMREFEAEQRVRDLDVSGVQAQAEMLESLADDIRYSLAWIDSRRAWLHAKGL